MPIATTSDQTRRNRAVSLGVYATTCWLARQWFLTTDGMEMDAGFHSGSQNTATVDIIRSYDVRLEIFTCCPPASCSGLELLSNS